jgi:hypothetical protein
MHVLVHAYFNLQLTYQGPRLISTMVRILYHDLQCGLLYKGAYSPLSSS